MYIYVYACICIQIYIYVCICIYINAIYMYVYTHTYVYIHMYISRDRQSWIWDRTRDGEAQRGTSGAKKNPSLPLARSLKPPLGSVPSACVLGSPLYINRLDISKLISIYACIYIYIYSRSDGLIRRSPKLDLGSRERWSD